jgi:hypothetical protein
LLLIVYKKGRENPPKGSRNCGAKLSEDQVVLIKQMYKVDGYGVNRLATIFGVERHAISKIILGKTWKDVL